MPRSSSWPVSGRCDPPARRRGAPAAAWRVAEQLGWAETYTAEYVALTQLQADAFVTLDAGLAKQVKGLVATAPVASLQTA